jgi:hypothetical protein
MAVVVVRALAVEQEEEALEAVAALNLIEDSPAVELSLLMAAAAILKVIIRLQVPLRQVQEILLVV